MSAEVARRETHDNAENAATSRSLQQTDLEEPIFEDLLVIDTANIPKNTADVEDARAPEPDIGICSEDGSHRLQNQNRRLWRGFDVCNLSAPGEVVNFHIECDNMGTYLDFQIADSGIPGDHWQLKGKHWDIYPQTAVTTSPARGYGVPGRIYNYGGSSSFYNGPWPGASLNPTTINALVECTYLHGVNLFGAGSYVYFQSDAARCTIKKSSVHARIDRSP